MTEGIQIPKITESSVSSDHNFYHGIVSEFIEFRIDEDIQKHHRLTAGFIRPALIHVATDGIDHVFRQRLGHTRDDESIAIAGDVLLLVRPFLDMDNVFRFFAGNLKVEVQSRDLVVILGQTVHP